MQTLFARFAGDDRGATAIEYALLAGMIGLALVASSLVLGNTVTSMFGAGEAANVIGTSTERLN
jgi:pilus assembly protein Flp/PilA